MTRDELVRTYEDYVACLNARDWAALGRFVAEDVSHNGRQFGLVGYRAMLEQDVLAIPDLSFGIDLLVCDPPRIASRLVFDCTPRARFLGLAVSGRRIRFAENVIYAFRDSKIANVWSVIDKAAIEAQL